MLWQENVTLIFSLVVQVSAGDSTIFHKLSLLLYSCECTDTGVIVGAVEGSITAVDEKLATWSHDWAGICGKCTCIL